ncbi:ppm2p [Saccharomyces arboricola H-6]|uniref:tRNA wybutosine-synthesizing protein 4 n=1 Tax=Saccharomyces arboricola (strain H-6 / AS 2.3317 / CBS 10644) TaxID=1160507 RepID=J8PZG3_SACAR|nr:ppm2p [Saccharomyces arboricola H-6]
MKDLVTEKQQNVYAKQERRKKYADLAIQGTNNSSIASKRSVELLYLPKLSSANNFQMNKNKELLEYFKFFVPKRIKRSPCINRGYWLRLFAIRSRLNSIIEQTPQDKKIIVVNLGCGYDPLPFQLLDTNNIQSQQYHDRVSFIDIDYSDLLKIKIELIKMIPELSKIIGLVEDDDYVDTSNSDVLTTPNYRVRPCNLNDSIMFRELLSECQLNDPNVVKVFIAEVSLAYMKPERSDSIIEACSQMENSHVIILEQLIPKGPFEPFSKRMLAHFKRNDSPLQSVMRYNTIDSQIKRFNELRFPHINVGDMFQLWESADEITKEELLNVEPFDELEEFHLFCHHYLLCHATNNTEFPFTKQFIFDRPTPEIELAVDGNYQLQEYECAINRKFGDAVVCGNNVFYMGGSNPCRVNEILELSISHDKMDIQSIELGNGELPIARMCHTLTSLHEKDQLLLIGGRKAPHQGLSDNWIFDIKEKKWTMIQDLSHTRFRHATCNLSDGNVLIFGGVTEGPVMLLYNTTKKTFQDITPNNESFRKTLVSAGLAFDSISNQGVILGGGFKDQTSVSDKAIVFKYNPENVIEPITVVKEIRHPLFERYGSQIEYLSPGKLLIVGGTSPSRLFDQTNSTISLDLQKETLASIPIPKHIWENHSLMLAGFKLISTADGTVYIIGGGATCYGFGSVTNVGLKLIANAE